MRSIGHLKNERSAATFSDYLYVHGIENQVEAERDGTWSVWVFDEESLNKARELLQSFHQDPGASHYHGVAEKARDLRSRAEAEEAAVQSRHLDREKLFRTGGFSRVGRVTLGLIALSVVATFLSGMGSNPEVMRRLLISAFEGAGLPEIRNGQVWRLITPIFLHGNPLHIILNMLWLYDLGSMIEGRQSSRYLIVLVVCLGVASNVGQYLFSGPNFVGMSGVVYGLLGYVWIRGKFDPNSGYFLHPQTVGLMIVWFFLCFTPFIPNIANGAHAVGLIGGMIWGFLTSHRIRFGDGES